VYLEENNNARIIINTSYNNNKRYVRANLPMSTSATHRQSWKQSTPSGEYIQTWDKASVGFAANIYVGDPIGVMHTSVAARMPRCHLAVRLYRNLRRFVVRHLCMLGDRLGCLYDIVLVRGDRLDNGR
jgi:hypothetical protein